MAQRSGAALPALLPRGMPPHEALEQARNMKPFDKALNLAFEPEVHRMVHQSNKHPRRVKNLRHGVIQHLRKLSRQLQPAKATLTRKLESKAPACSLNIPLIMFLTKSLNYSDVNLPRDLIYGMGITGKIETTNSIAKRETLASTSIESAKQSLRGRNESIITDLLKTKDPTLKQQ